MWDNLQVMALGINRWLISITLVLATWNNWAFNYGFGQDTVARSQLVASVRQSLSWGGDYLLAYGPLHFLLTPIWLHDDVFSLFLMMGHVILISLIFNLFLLVSHQLKSNPGLSILLLYLVASYTSQISRDGHFATLIGPLLFLIWFGLANLHFKESNLESSAYRFLLATSSALTGATIFVKISTALPAHIGFAIFLLIDWNLFKKSKRLVLTMVFSYGITCLTLFIWLVRINPADFIYFNIEIGKAYSYHISGDRFPSFISLIFTVTMSLIIFFYLSYLGKLRLKLFGLKFMIFQILIFLLLTTYLKQGMTRISDHLPHLYLSLITTLFGLAIFHRMLELSPEKQKSSKAAKSRFLEVKSRKERSGFIKALSICILIASPLLSDFRNPTLNPYFNFFVLGVLIYCIANLSDRRSKKNLDLTLNFSKGGAASLFLVTGLFFFSNFVDSREDYSLNSTIFSEWVKSDNKIKLFSDGLFHVLGQNGTQSWESNLRQDSNISKVILDKIESNSGKTLLTFESSSAQLAFADSKISANYVTEQRILDSAFIAEKFKNNFSSEEQLSGILHKKGTPFLLDGSFGRFILCNFKESISDESWQYFDRISNRCKIVESEILSPANNKVEVSCPKPNELLLVQLNDFKLTSNFQKMMRLLTSLYWRSYSPSLTIDGNQSVEMSPYFFREGVIVGSSDDLNFGKLSSIKSCSDHEKFTLSVNYPLNYIPDAKSRDMDIAYKVRVSKFELVQNK